MTQPTRSPSTPVPGARSRRPPRPTGVLGGLIVASLLVLTGCVTAPSPVASPSPSRSASAPPVATPAAEPELIAHGTAEDNLAFFNLVNQRFLDPNLVPGGRGIIDNLVAAGFDKAAMQVTADETPIGRPVDSVQFSVRLGDACLIGQASAAGYVGIVGPPVSATSCLAGITRAIDW